jgi:hypothetical protein
MAGVRTCSGPAAGPGGYPFPGLFVDLVYIVGYAVSLAAILAAQADAPSAEVHQKEAFAVLAKEGLFLLFTHRFILTEHRCFVKWPDGSFI